MITKYRCLFLSLSLSLIVSGNVRAQSKAATQVEQNSSAAAVTTLDFAAFYNYVTKINVGEDNYLYINVTPNLSTSHGCDAPWFVRSKYPLTDERTKAWLNIATQSFQLHKQVWLETSGCNGGGSVGYPLLTKLQVQQ